MPHEKQNFGGMACLRGRAAGPSPLLPARDHRHAGLAAPDTDGPRYLRHPARAAARPGRPHQLDADAFAGLHACGLRLASHPVCTPDAPAGRTQWITIGAIVVSLLVGTAVLMASLAFSFQRYFEYQIEEARKI